MGAGGALSLSALLLAQVLLPPRWLDENSERLATPPGDQWELAAAATSRGTFVVWTDGRTDGAWGDVYAAHLDDAGAWQPPAGFLLAGGPLGQRLPSIACGAGQCLVAWVDTLAGFVAQRFTEAGVALEPAPRSLGFTAGGRPRLAFSGGQFMAAWNSSGSVWTVLVDLAGQPGAPVKRVDGNVTWCDEAALAGGAAGFLLQWQNALGAFAQALTVTGQAVAAPVQLSTVKSRRPQALARGAQWLTSWTVPNTTYAYSGPLHGRELAADGLTLSPERLLVASPLPNLETTLTSLGARTLVAWSTRGNPLRLFTTVLEEDGGVGPDQLVANTSDDNVLIAAAPVDGGVQLAWADQPVHAAYDLQAVRLDAAASRLGAPRALEKGPEDQRTPTLGVLTDGGLVAAWMTPATSDAGLNELRYVFLDPEGAPRGAPATFGGAGWLHFPVFIPSTDAPWLAWRRAASSTVLRYELVSLEAPLAAPVALSSTLETNAGPAVAVSAGAAAWLIYCGLDTGTWRLRGVRVDRSGARLDPPGRVLAASCSGNTPAAAWASGPGTLLVVEGEDPLQAQRFAADGAALDATARALAIGSYPKRPALASDGQDYLLAWVDFWEQVYCQRVDGTTGDLVGAPLLVRAHPSALHAGQGRVLATFDGRDYVLTLSDVTVDGGQDVWLARVPPDVQSVALEPFAVSPAAELPGALVTTSPGRVAAVGLAHHPTLSSARAFARVSASVPLGGLCLSAGECVSGVCTNNVCCPSDGTGCFALTDAGQPGDGGEPGDAGGPGDAGVTGTVPRPQASYAVGCGCQSVMELTPLLVWLLARRRRDVRGRPERQEG